jgi:hypothetical protein
VLFLFNIFGNQKKGADSIFKMYLRCEICISFVLMRQSFIINIAMDMPLICPRRSYLNLRLDWQNVFRLFPSKCQAYELETLLKQCLLIECASISRAPQFGVFSCVGFKLPLLCRWSRNHVYVEFHCVLTWSSSY